MQGFEGHGTQGIGFGVDGLGVWGWGFGISVKGSNFGSRV